MKNEVKWIVFLFQEKKMKLISISIPTKYEVFVKFGNDIL
jgi:hypothetical protein